MKDRQGYFNVRSLFWGLGISIICDVAKTSFWISVIIGMILGVLTLLVVNKTNETKCAKFISGFVFAILSALILSYMGSTLYLKETPVWLLVLVALIGSFIISGSRDFPYKRTVYLLFIVAIATFLCSHVLLLKEALPDNLLPMFNTSSKNVICGALIFYLYSVTPLLALNNMDNKRNMVINYVMGCLTTFLSILLCVMVLGMDETILYRYPEYGLLKRIEVFEFFSNVDNVFLTVMVMDLLVTCSAGIRNMDIKGKVPNLIVFGLLFLVIVNLERSAGVMATLYDYLPFVMLFLLILTLIPIKSKYKSSSN